MIAAGVVLFNPDLDRLERNIESFIDGVDAVYCFDNSSDNIKEITKLLKKYFNIKLIQSNQNKGIAYALNRIMECAQKDGHQWVLTMDQDSICREDMVSKLISYINYQQVGMISPHIKEINGTREQKKHTEQYEYTDFCITSGTLTQIEAWQRVGGFDEWMFIDIVDFEICAKMREAGYKVLQINDAILLQEVGKLKEVIIGKRHLYIRNHSAFRKYYFTRNLLYCNYCHPNTFTYRYMLNLLITTYIKTILFENEKLKKLRRMNKGIRDAKRKIRELKKEK